MYGQQKYLVMMDADVLAASDGLNSTQTNCDVICLVYDASNPRSFEYCARIYLVSEFYSEVVIRHVCLKCDDSSGISPPPKCRCWWWQIKVTEAWSDKITFSSPRLSVPSTSCRLLRGPRPGLHPLRTSSSSSLQWPPSREYQKVLRGWITVQLSIIANVWSCYSKFQAAWMLFYRGRWLLFNSSILSRNLKRLVHDMILKRPPGEWLGLLRLYWIWV